MNRPVFKIHKRKKVTVQRAYGDLEEWSVNERAVDGIWIQHNGDVYTTQQLKVLIKQLKQLDKYLDGRKRK